MLSRCYILSVKRGSGVGVASFGGLLFLNNFSESRSNLKVFPDSDSAGLSESRKAICGDLLLFGLMLGAILSQSNGPLRCGGSIMAVCFFGITFLDHVQT